MTAGARCALWIAALSAALGMSAAFAQAPRVSTLPANPSENDDVTIAIAGDFPSTDYRVTDTTFVRTEVPAASAHGANEFEYLVNVRYRYGPAGGQAITPFEVRIPGGRFPRFARIKVSVAFVPDAGLAMSSWFRTGTYDNYVYVRDPEPPRIALVPATPSSNQAVRLTLRWYHTKYFAARTTHELAGSTLRIRQDVVYVGPDSSPEPLSEAVVMHDVGALPAGDYVVDWRQSVGGQGAATIATLPFRVAMDACASCGATPARLALEATSVAFDSFPLGTMAGPQTVALTPRPLDLGPIQGVPPPEGVYLHRIWTNNMDFVVSHDCPAPSATITPPTPITPARPCTVTVHYQGTLRGENVGKLFVRYSDYTGTPRTTSMTLKGRTLRSRGITFSPPPFTPDTAVEYYAAALDHYFFTSSPQERAFVDGGGAGAWQRTGIEFPVGGPTDVCRFYGDPTAGPRSHFYTASATECASLRSLDAVTPRGTGAWRYEGIALRAEAPKSPDGFPSQRPYCRDDNSRFPIYRVFNDGPDRAVDSNHRHVPARGVLPGGKSGEDVVREMIARGWIYEGNALCN